MYRYRTAIEGRPRGLCYRCEQFKPIVAHWGVPNIPYQVCADCDKAMLSAWRAEHAQDRKG